MPPAGGRRAGWLLPDSVAPLVCTQHRLISVTVRLYPSSPSGGAGESDEGPTKEIKRGIKGGKTEQKQTP